MLVIMETIVSYSSALDCNRTSPRYVPHTEPAWHLRIVTVMLDIMVIIASFMNAMACTPMNLMYAQPTDPA